MGMRLAELWKIEDIGERFEAMLFRYMELDAMTGNRTTDEVLEMGEIAQAVMPELIKVHRGRSVFGGFADQPQYGQTGRLRSNPPDQVEPERMSRLENGE